VASVVAALAITGTRPLAAQSSLWGATLTIAPAPSPFVSDWARNPTIAQLSVFYQGTTAETIRLEAIVTERRRGELGRGLSGLKDVPLGPYSLQFSTQDLVDWAAFDYDPAIRSQIVRTGLLPEGDYQICLRVRNQFGGAVLTQACSDFRISYPEAAQLIAPASGSGVSVAQPTFQWTPVQAPVEAGVRYRLRIAKRLPGQTSLAALQANVPQHEGDAGSTPFYLYPQDALPLDTGATYVWQVQTLTKDGVPFSAGGRPSEIWSFAWGPSGPGGPRRVADRPFSDTLTLVPGVARLRGLSLANATESDFDVRLDGSAMLELTAPTGGTVTIPVEVRGLTIEKGAIVPLVSAGRVVGRVDGDRLPSGWRSPFVRLRDVEYAPSSGVTFGGQFVAGATRVPMSGRVQLTASGLDGTLVAERDGASPFVTLGAGAARVAVTRASAVWPGAATRLDGETVIFGQRLECQPLSLRLTADGSTATTTTLSCIGTSTVPLREGGTRVALRLDGARLQVIADAAREVLTVDGEVSAALALDARSGTSLPPTCAARVRLVVAGDSAIAKDGRDVCDGDRVVPMGWLAVGLRNLRVEQLTWHAATGFDLRGAVDLRPVLAAAPALALPYLSDVRLTRDGLALPAADAAASGAPVALGGWQLAVSRSAVEATQWRWSDWDAGRADSIALNVSGTLALGADAPRCASVAMPITSARIVGGRVRVALQDASIAEGCALAAGKAALEVSAIGGVLTATLRDTAVVTDTLPTVVGRVRWPSSWGCASTDATTPLASRLALRSDAQPSGDAAVGAVACAAPVAPFALRLSAGTLTWRGPDAVWRGAPAVLGSSGPLSTQGTVALDVATARIVDGALTVTSPARLAVPTARPVLSFELGGFTLAPTGLAVDGRHALRIGASTTIGATFVNALVDSAGRIARGAVRFDTTFALSGPAVPSPVGWTVVPAGADAPTGGLRMDWPAGVTLDATGLHSAGSARAALRVEGVHVPDARVQTDAAFAFDPATGEIRAGTARVTLGGETVATIGTFGVRLEPAAVARAALPSRLAVPSLNGAYLEVRRGDSVFVTTEIIGDALRVRSRPGQPVTLAVPALVTAGAPPPTTAVTVDLTFTGLYERIQSGRISAVNAAALRTALDAATAGLPLEIDSLALGTREAAAVLELHGRPLLFGAARGRAHAVVATIGGDGAISLPLAAEIAARVRLGGTSDVAVYVADSLVGRAERRDGRATLDATVVGALELGNTSAARWRAPFGLTLTERGIGAGTLGTAAGDSASLDVGGVRLRLASAAVTRFAWTPSGGFDYEIALEGPLAVPLLDVTTPTVRGLSLVPQGLSVPAVLVPEISGDGVLLAGYRVAARALRIKRGLLPIFGGDTTASVALDLEIGFGQLPSDASAASRSVSLSALDVALRDGRLVGAIEPRDFTTPVSLPLGEGAALRVRHFEGALSDSAGRQQIVLDGRAVLQLPSALRCRAGDTLSLSTALLRFDGGARANGRVDSVTLPCGVPVGRIAVGVSNGTLRVTSAAGTPTAVLLEGSATAAFAGATGDSVRARGTVAVDLLGGRLVSGALSVEQSFRLNVPAGGSLLSFEVPRAQLDSSGLILGGGGQVLLGDGAAAPVTFAGLTLDPTTLAVRGGRATFPDGLGLGATLAPGGPLTWRAWPAALANAASMAVDGVRLRLPQDARLDASGFSLSGDLSGAVRFGGEPIDATVRAVSGAPTFVIADAGVRGGRLRFRRGNDDLATLDSSGVTPASVFAARTLPARLALGDSAAAYLVLRTDAGLSVQSEASDTALRIFTRPNETIGLALPALAKNGVVPVVPVAVSLTLDPRTLAPKSGVLDVVGANGSPLTQLMAANGAAADVMSLHFGPRGGRYGLTANVRVTLPASFGSASVQFDSVSVAAGGLAPMSVGRLAATADAAARPLRTVSLGEQVSLDLFGVAWRPSGDSAGVSVTASVTSPLFDGVTKSALYFGARIDERGISAPYDAAAWSATRFTSGQFTFEPAAFGSGPATELSVSANALTVSLRGTLRLPDRASSFAVSVQDIRLGTGGLVFPSRAVEAGPAAQEVRLFGGTMSLRRVGQAPALGLAWRTGALRLTLSGALQIVGRPTNVDSLEIGGDGALGIGSAAAFTIVPALGQGGGTPVAAVSSVAATDGKLTLNGRVALPAPFRAQQGDGGEFSLRLGLDGIPDSTRVVVWDQAEGCCQTAGRMLFPLGPMARLHARHLVLALDAADVSRSSVALVADAYVGATDETRGQNRIAIGSTDGGDLKAGLTIGFDGSVTLGNVALKREFTFNFRALTLTVSQVAVDNTVTLNSAGVNGDGSPFALKVGGSLTLNVASVTGAIGFQNVSIGSAGVGFAPTSLQSATLKIAGVLSLELKDLAIVTRDTTVSIASTDSSSGGRQTLAVSNLVMFGGRLTLEGSGLSGGVDRFLFYQTPDNVTALIIEGASLNIPNTLEFRADFSFVQRSDGFAMRLGASGTLLQKVSVGLYGMISQSSSDGLRLGMFLRSTVQIPIIPGVLIASELGAGFFYRPLESDINGAWRAAGLDPSLRSMGDGVPARNNGDLTIAILLYGRVEIVTSTVASGRTLITITDRYFEIFADVTLMGRTGELTGSVRLKVGLQEAFAEGDIRVAVAFPGVVTGNARLAFFVYGADTWGVLGSMNLRVLGFLNASGRLFIGPPGFLVTMSVSAGFDISILTVSASFRAAFWYVKQNNELGGFAEVNVSASLLSGLITASAGLRGAFLIQSSSWLVYASAYLRVDTPVGDFEGSVWLKMENGNIDGGLGRDETMDRLVARAAQVEQMMQSAATQASNAVAASRNAAATLSVSRAELSAAFDRFQQYDELYRGTLASQANRIEDLTDAPLGMAPEWSQLRQTYARAITLQIGTDAIWLQRVAAPNTDSLITELESVREQVSRRLRDIAVRVQSQADMPYPAAPEDPLTASLPDSVSAVTTVVNGKPARSVPSMPSFRVDAAKSQEARARTMAWMALGNASTRQLRAAMDSLEATLRVVRTVVADTGEQSFVRFGQRYSAARELVEGFVVSSIAQARLRARNATEAVTTLNANAAPLATQVRLKTTKLSAAGWTAAADVLSRRAAVLERLGVAGLSARAVAERFRTEDATLWPALRANLDTLGLALWVRFGQENMPRLRDTLIAQATALEQGKAVQDLQKLRQGHAELSAAAQELFDAQSALYATMLDTYEAYAKRSLIPGSDNTWSEKTRTVPVDELLAVLARREELRSLHRVIIGAPSVSVVAFDRMYSGMVRADLTGGATNADAYFVAEEAAGDAPSPWYLVGKQTSNWFRFLSPTLQTTSQSRVLRVQQRARTGAPAERRVPYTAIFMQPGANSGRGVWATQQYDPTPPSAPTFSVPGGMEFTAPSGPFAGRRLLYVPRLDNLLVQWSATSNTGVVNWEIGVGSTPDSSDILPMRNPGGRRSFTFGGLGDVRGRPIHFRGRATSGDGVVGPFGASPPVVVDTIAPRLALTNVAPQPAPPAAPTAALRPSQLGATAGLLTACPDTRPAEQDAWFRAVPMPARTVRVLSGPAVDVGTGIAARWFYRVDSVAATSLADTIGWTAYRGGAVDLDGAAFSYRAPRVVNFAARNPSGAASNVVTTPPVTLTGDKTPPTPPSFCGATLAADGTLSFAPSALSTDPETPVLGYQVAVWRGNTLLRGFPSANVVDIPAAAWQPGARVTPSANGTPISVPATDADTSTLVLQVRAINADGVPSAHSGQRMTPLLLLPPDLTVRVTGVSTSFGLSTASLRVTPVLEPGKAPNPIIEYRVQTPTPTPWTTGGTSFTLRWPSGVARTVNVEIRARNAMGHVGRAVLVTVTR
jgi:hypothetical protein